MAAGKKLPLRLKCSPSLHHHGDDEDYDDEDCDYYHFLHYHEDDFYDDEYKNINCYQ